LIYDFSLRGIKKNRVKLQNETPEQEIARLKAELHKASQERDILKKATAYFASLEK